MKKTNSSIDGTSFHNITITASVNDLINVLGEPTFQGNTGEDKVNFIWDMETDDGDVFTLYSWKEYRKISDIEIIEWHIGARNRSISNKAQYEIMRELNS